MGYKLIKSQPARGGGHVRRGLIRGGELSQGEGGSFEDIEDESVFIGCFSFSPFFYCRWSRAAFGPWRFCYHCWYVKYHVNPFRYAIHVWSSLIYQIKV